MDNRFRWCRGSRIEEAVKNIHINRKKKPPFLIKSGVKCGIHYHRT